MAARWGERVTTTRLRALALLGGVLLATGAGGLLPFAASADSTSPSPAPSGSGSSAGAASTPVTFGIGPSTKGKIDSRSGFTTLVQAGGSTRDEFAVVNLTEAPLTLNIYAADAYNSPDGTLALEPASTKPVDAAAWVRFATPTGKGFIVLKPRETRYIPFTVRVPKNAYAGDHLAGVIASTVTAGQTPGERGTDLKLEQRVALRLGVRVAGELRPELTIENLTASYTGTLNPFGTGTAVVSYTVHNTGNVRLGGRQSVHVQGLTGPAALATDVPDVPMLLPGGTAAVTLPVEGVSPLLHLTAAVTVTVLAPAGDANPPAAVATATTTFWAIPWTLLALLLLAAIVGAWFWRRRASGGSGPGRREAGSTPGSAELVSAGSRHAKS